MKPLRYRFSIVWFLIIIIALFTCSNFGTSHSIKHDHVYTQQLLLLKGEKNLIHMKKFSTLFNENAGKYSNKRELNDEGVDIPSSNRGKRRKITMQDVLHIKRERSVGTMKHVTERWNVFNINPFIKPGKKRFPNDIMHELVDDKYHVIVSWKDKIEQHLTGEMVLLSEHAQSLVVSLIGLESLLENNRVDKVEHFDPIYKFDLNHFSYMLPQQVEVSISGSVPIVKRGGKPENSNWHHTFTDSSTQEEFIILKILVNGKQQLDSLQQVLELIKKKTGNSILKISKQISEGFAITISKKEALALTYEIAKLPFVFWIEALPKFELFNKWAKGLTQSGTALQNSLTTQGLTGRGQIIGVGDSGLDGNSCFFHDPNHPVPYTNNTNAKPSQHRKIISYWSFMDEIAEDDAHGTHVSGTIVSQSILADSPLSDFNGIASEAKIVFTDLNCVNEEGCSCKDSPNGCPCDGFSGKCGPSANYVITPYSLSKDYFPFSYNMGARIHSNSWGSTSWQGYSSTSMDIDKYAWEHKDFLILFAAGNTGNYEGYSSISTSADSKNIVTVGASMSSVDANLYAYENIRDYDKIATSYAKYLMDEKYHCSFNESSISETCDARKNEICNMLVSIKGQEDCCDRSKWSVCSDDIYYEGCGCSLDNIGAICCKFCSIFQTFHQGPTQNENDMAFFSSIGPASDGRIKPDVVAPGSILSSARSHHTVNSPTKCSGNSSLSYNLMEAQGTSMSTPLVAAIAALARQFFVEGWYPSGKNESKHGFNPSSALIKATLINSAVPLLGTFSYQGETSYIHERNENAKFRIRSRSVEGFGKVQLDKTLAMNGTNSNTDLLIGRVSNLYSNHTVLQEFGDPIISSTIEMHTYCIIPKDTNRNITNLKITLVWTDYPSNPSRLKHLVNNLDLGVLDGTDIFFGNSEKNSLERDSINNVEQVEINTVQSSRIIINIESTFVFSAQSYAFLVTGKNIKFDNCTEKDQQVFIAKTRKEGSTLIVREIVREIVIRNETIYVTPSIDPVICNDTQPTPKNTDQIHSETIVLIIGIILIILAILILLISFAVFLKSKNRQPIHKLDIQQEELQ